MPIPWEISAALAGAALLVLGVVAGLTLIEIRRTLRNVMALSAATERHLPAILQSLDEISRNAAALASSVRTLSGKASAIDRGFERITGSVHVTVQSLEKDVVEPVLKAVKGVSTLLAFGAALRGLRHPLGLLLLRGKGRP